MPKPCSAQWPEITAALRQPPAPGAMARPSGVMERVRSFSGDLHNVLLAGKR